MSSSAFCRQWLSGPAPVSTEFSTMGDPAQDLDEGPGRMLLKGKVEDCWLTYLQFISFGILAPLQPPPSPFPLPSYHPLNTPHPPQFKQKKGLDWPLGGASFRAVPPSWSTCRKSGSGIWRLRIAPGFISQTIQSESWRGSGEASVGEKKKKKSVFYYKCIACLAIKKCGNL